MPVRLKITKLLLILPAISLLAGCVTIYNPATERKEMLLLDTSQEVALGTDMNNQLQRKLKILNDPLMQSRLNSIGARVGGASDRQDLIYHFGIVKDKEFNAFAIPGGFIYVNSGLMDAATDDELACVLAHEIGHIAARHSVKRLQTTLGYQLIMSIALGATSGGQTTASAIDVVFNLVDLGYGRKDELLADKLAVRYSKRAGFDPHAMITFFEKLKKEEEKGGGGFNLPFLSSHPPLEQRIKNIEKEIAASP
jgi:predicted Zn-dependent protease